MTRNNAKEIHLPGSKSISNRALILAYLHGAPFKNIYGLSDSRDTQLLLNALRQLESDSHEESDSNEIIPTFDFLDAGTPSRFFLTLCAVLGKPCIITGNESLQNRSIESLVDVLSFGGCKIQYVNQYGFFPVQLLPRENYNNIATNRLKFAINRSISSQFVSAIMLISCSLMSRLKNNAISNSVHENSFPNSDSIISTELESLDSSQIQNYCVEIELLGHSHSDSYIKMTASVMRDFGYQIEFRDQTIFISGDYNGKQEYTVEADWSSVSYFLNQMLVQDSVTEISIKNLRFDSYQGDRKMISFYEELGLEFEFQMDQLLVRRNSNLNNPNQSKNLQSTFENKEAEVPFPEILHENSNHPTTQTDKFDFDWDLGDIPDTVPSLVAALVILKKSAYLRNIHNLIYKESNRIAVLNENLTRFGFQLIQDSKWPNNYFLNSMSTQLNSFPSDLNLPNLPFRTHSDHRMAMTFASITNFTVGFTNNSTSKLGELNQEVKINSSSKPGENNQKVKYDSTHKLVEFSQWVDDVDCVEKSFPQFWKEFQKLGS